MGRATVDVGREGRFAFRARLPAEAQTITFQAEEIYRGYGPSGLFPLQVTSSGQVAAPSTPERRLMPVVLVVASLVALSLLAIAVMASVAGVQLGQTTASAEPERVLAEAEGPSCRIGRDSKRGDRLRSRGRVATRRAMTMSSMSASSLAGRHRGRASPIRPLLARNRPGACPRISKEGERVGRREAAETREPRFQHRGVIDVLLRT